MNNPLIRNAVVTIASFVFVISVVSAWTAPGTTAPGGNVSAPITVGATNQEKIGGLWVASFGVTGNSSFLGNVGIGTESPSEKLDVNGNVKAVAYFYASDNRLKENIKPLTKSLDKLGNLTGYSFDWKETGKKDIGVIAQEVEIQFPELVHTDKRTGMKSVEYGNLIAPLIEAVKELSFKVESQSEEIESLQTEIQILKSRE